MSEHSRTIARLFPDPPEAAALTLLPDWIPLPGIERLIPRWWGDPARWAPERVPARDPHYLLREEEYDKISVALEPDAAPGEANALLMGEAGGGKTSFIQQLAAHARAPLVVVDCHADTRTHHLLGLRTLKGGEVVLERGPVARAFEAGWWLLLDEVTAPAPGVLQALHGLLGGARELWLEDGSRVTRGAGFRVFATSNVAGQAVDRRHRFGGNYQINDATLSRFGIRFALEPLDPEEIRALLTAWSPASPHPLAAALAEHLVDWYNELREAAEGDRPELRYMVTLRDLKTLWTAWQRPVRKPRGGIEHRDLSAMAGCTILGAMQGEKEREYAERLLWEALP